MHNALRVEEEHDLARKLGTIGGIGLAIAIPISGGFGISYAVNAMPLESSVEIPTSKTRVRTIRAKTWARRCEA